MGGKQFKSIWESNILKISKQNYKLISIMVAIYKTKRKTKPNQSFFLFIFSLEIWTNFTFKKKKKKVMDIQKENSDLTTHCTSQITKRKQVIGRKLGKPLMKSHVIILLFLSSSYPKIQSLSNHYIDLKIQYIQPIVIARPIRIQVQAQNLCSRSSPK